MRCAIATTGCLALLALMACRADMSDLRVTTPEQVAAWQAAGQRFALCDANSRNTRERHGVIASALLLTSYRDYDPARELPADRDERLVFYCANERCGAAGEAARRAIAAGHRDVWVMPRGIQGWVAAGLPAALPPEARS